MRLMQKKINISRVIKKNVFLQPQKTAGCSAVGSALRSGRRGRKFESSHPDQTKRQSDWIAFFRLEIIDERLEIISLSPL